MRLDEALKEISPKTALSSFSTLLQHKPSFTISWSGNRFVSFAEYGGTVPLDSIATVFIKSVASEITGRQSFSDRLHWSNLCEGIQQLYSESRKDFSLFSRILLSAHRWRIWFRADPEETSLCFEFLQAICRWRIFSNKKVFRIDLLLYELSVAFFQWHMYTLRMREKSTILFSQPFSVPIDLSETDPEIIIMNNNPFNLSERIRAISSRQFEILFCGYGAEREFCFPGGSLHTIPQEQLNRMARTHNL